MIELNKESFQKLIDDDIKWLKVVLRSDAAQKSHILQVLEQATDKFYPPPNNGKCNVCACWEPEPVVIDGNCIKACKHCGTVSAQR